jgi:hypothetical protein
MADTYELMPVPKMQFFGPTGTPLANGYLYTYQPQTTIPKPTYSDSRGSAYNPNPVQLDSQGRASIWLLGAYYIELWTGDKNTSGSSLVYSQDNVSVSSTVATVDLSNFFVGLSKITVDSTAPTSPIAGDLWVDTSI